MKKLNLSQLKNDAVKILSKEQQKSLTGGYTVKCTCNGVSKDVTCSTTEECVSACWNAC